MQKKRSTYYNGSYFFLTKKNLSHNVIAKYRYLPCIQYKKSDRFPYGCRAAKRILRQSLFFKATEFQNFTHFAEKSFKPISAFESKRVDKIKSGHFMFLSTFISST